MVWQFVDAIPQRLKPESDLAIYGTTEVVP
jgi:hypothetical protein